MRFGFVVAQVRATQPGLHLGELFEEGVVVLEALLISTGRSPLAKQVARVVRP